MKKIIKISLCILSIITVHSNIQGDGTQNNHSLSVETVNQEANRPIQDRFEAKSDILKNRKWQKNSTASQKNQPQETHPEFEDIYDIDNSIYYAKKTPLIDAVKKNNLLQVQELLQQKIDINLRDLQGKTAYDYALEKSKNWISLPSQRALAKKIAELVKPYNAKVENPNGSMKELD